MHTAKHSPKSKAIVRGLKAIHFSTGRPNDGESLNEGYFQFEKFSLLQYKSSLTIQRKSGHEVNFEKSAALMVPFLIRIHKTAVLHRGKLLLSMNVTGRP